MELAETKDYILHHKENLDKHVICTFKYFQRTFSISTNFRCHSTDRSEGLDHTYQVVKELRDTGGGGVLVSETTLSFIKA